MNPGQFANQITVCWQIIRKLNLDREQVYQPAHPSNPAALFRSLNYPDYWRTCLQDQYYNFQLTDNSLLHFRVDSFKPLKCSYAYLECPYVVISYKDFLQSVGLTEDEVGDHFREEYEASIQSAEVKLSAIPIRYDFDLEGYAEGLHPVSHMHFGHGNQIRVGAGYVLRPISFVLFILRQCYKEEWKKFHSFPEAETWCNEVRYNLDWVDDGYRLGHNKREMWLW